MWLSAADHNMIQNQSQIMYSNLKFSCSNCQHDLTSEHIKNQSKAYPMPTNKLNFSQGTGI